MGWYERKVFPWILERIDGPEIQALRSRCVARAEGRVLEIGLGTGKTLPHYGPNVESLVALEPRIGMTPSLRERLSGASFPVEVVEAAGESIPFRDESFDAVVISMVLCSVDLPSQVLAEVSRVLRPGGRFHFLEHVASEKPSYLKWQHRLNGLQRIIGCGCNLNRRTVDEVQTAGLIIEEMERHVSKEMPFIPELFPLVVATARKATSRTG